jgi:hypothetical protein
MKFPLGWQGMCLDRNESTRSGFTSLISHRPLLGLFVLTWPLVLAARSALASSDDAARTFDGLVGVGSSVFELALMAAVYVISFGFFIWMACNWTGIKSTLGDAFGAAIFVGIFTVVIYGVHVFLRPILDPHDPMYSKAVLVVGLILAGPMAIKTTYGEGLVGSFKTFLIAAVMTGVVMGGLWFILDAVRGQKNVPISFIAAML